MYFNFGNFLPMSLLNEQANLSLPTTKTTEMIEISITFIIWLIFRYFCKKKSIGQSIGSLRPILIPIPKKRPILFFAYSFFFNTLKGLYAYLNLRTL